jgi:hypothetical protein
MLNKIGNQTQRSFINDQSNNKSFKNLENSPMMVVESFGDHSARENTSS